MSKPSRYSGLLKIFGGVALAALVSHPALAQDIGTVATNTSGTFNSVAKMITAAGGLGGIALFLLGSKDLVTATTQPGQNVKHSHAFVKMGAGALLFSGALGLNVMKNTLFESSGTSTITPNTISVTN